MNIVRAFQVTSGPQLSCPQQWTFFFFYSKAGSETAGREVLSSMELDWTFPLGAESRQ